jgi:hypothetical protein
MQCLSVAVVCPVCTLRIRVRSRRGFSAFDESHRASCQSPIVLLGPTLNDVLDLPPEDDQ